MGWELGGGVAQAPGLTTRSKKLLGTRASLRTSNKKLLGAAQVQKIGCKLQSALDYSRMQFTS